MKIQIPKTIKAGFSVLATTLTFIAFTSSVRASADMNSSKLPPIGNDITGVATAYSSTQTSSYSGGGFKFGARTYDQFTSNFPLPAGSSTSVNSFSLKVTGTDSFDGGASFHPFSAPAATTWKISGNGGSGTGTFNTEMLQLDMRGGNLPPSVLLRESPTLASLGQTTITDIGGGNFRIDSFFDVFTELSVDAGQTWSPDSSGPTHVTFGQVPEPTSAVLLGLGTLLLAARRRRCAQA